jgi:hypothetical protein
LKKKIILSQKPQLANDHSSNESNHNDYKPKTLVNNFSSPVKGPVPLPLRIKKQTKPTPNTVSNFSANKDESQNSEKKLKTLTENCTMEEMEDDEV